MSAIQPQSNTTTISDLALVGDCGYEIQNDQVIINISEIANYRELENISGTLSIELWALDKPYTGDEFNGLALAGTPIGELFGQHSLNNCLYNLNFQEPSAGTWYLTLMLREWTETGYFTRDYVNFALPYIVSSSPTILRNETDNVINVSFSGNKKTLATAAVEKSNSPATTAAEKTSSPATAKANNPDKAKAQNETAISLNSASVKDIVSVKGISSKLAENIDAARPFESLDEVLKVKGMGPKLWKKLRDFFTL
ncbi:MAG: helix-hairpin-helix domain-containing protein [Methylococcales bacterium]|nr:helix-hairpin-helix domain-containing protein [Methylococcales bacterium]